MILEVSVLKMKKTLSLENNIIHTTGKCLRPSQIRIEKQMRIWKIEDHEKNFEISSRNIWKLLCKLLYNHEIGLDWIVNSFEDGWYPWVPDICLNACTTPHSQFPLRFITSLSIAILSYPYKICTSILSRRKFNKDYLLQPLCEGCVYSI